MLGFLCASFVRQLELAVARSHLFCIVVMDTDEAVSNGIAGFAWAASFADPLHLRVERSTIWE